MLFNHKMDARCRIGLCSPGAARMTRPPASGPCHPPTPGRAELFLDWGFTVSPTSKTSDIIPYILNLEI